MKCPDCSTKLTTKHYDTAYGWYECPKCEGAFTVDEIQEVTHEPDKPKSRRQQGDRSRPKRAKTGRGRGTQREDARRAHKGVQKANGTVRDDLQAVKVVAKGKKRRTEIQEDAGDLADEQVKLVASSARASAEISHGRNELETKQILNIWQDEITDIAEELGVKMDDANTRETALILWREIHFNSGATAREKEVPHSTCEVHA